MGGMAEITALLLRKKSLLPFPQHSQPRLLRVELEFVLQDRSMILERLEI